MSQIRLCWRPILTLIMILASVACAKRPPLPVDPYNPPPDQGIKLGEFLAGVNKYDFLAQVSFNPQDAKYYDLVYQVLGLTPEELVLLRQNGFVLTDRLAFTDFTTAYAYIYWKDLPVVVTTDSILHAIHQTYDDLLIQLEEKIFTYKLAELLRRCREQLYSDALANDDPRLDDLYADLDVYLIVALSLFTEDIYNSPEAKPYIKLAEAADSVSEVELFGSQRKIDFTLFKPRGHYTKSEALERYFRAMSWLAQIDFRLVEYDPQGNPKLNAEHIAAATLLRDIIDRAGQRARWEELDTLFSALIGHSDNVVLPDLDRFLADAGMNVPSDIIRHPDPDQLLTLITTNDYGQQRITGQILQVGLGNPTPIPRPISFMLLGQRFTVDAYLMSNLVYDRLLVDGHKVQRPLPSPLDVMYVLGNNRAATHLKDELSQYGYQANLAALRKAVDGYDQGFWTSSFYNRWLGALRELDIDTTGESFPQAMRTAAWADKTLHTQLASWTQLRHDNILYAKQSVSAEPICEYPAGYVEPYPLFYAAVGDYAQTGQTLFEKLDPTDLTQEGREIHQTALTYFEDLGIIAGRLQTMAEKELRQEPFSAEEERFLKSIAIRQLEEKDNICAIVTVEEWQGWYVDLFPWKDNNPALIADVHTNINNDPNFPDLYPPSVLHVGTGPVAPLILIADTDEGPTAYIGPGFTYYEVIEEGFPPTRLSDKEWNERLSTLPRPTPPKWTQSFRLPTSKLPRYLELPGLPYP